MENQTFLVGTGVENIYSCSLTSDGKLKLINKIKSGKGPSWLLSHENFLYAVNEHSNELQTFSIDDCKQGTLTLKNTISSIGNTPCSLDIDSTGKWLAVANYGYPNNSNFVRFPLNESKIPDETQGQIDKIDGRGPHPDRQNHSYCHQVKFHNNILHVVDLGTDTLNLYDFNSENGQVNLIGDRIKTVAGAGPRHILFHPDKPLAFVCNELNSTAAVYRINNSKLENIQIIKTRRQTDENNSKKENYPAELQFTPDKKFLIVSNRGDENLVIFHINDDENGQILTVKEHLDCQGSFTRYFTFDPTGKFLLLANQKSNDLICFSYDKTTNAFEFVSKLENIESPQHIVFL